MLQGKESRLSDWLLWILTNTQLMAWRECRGPRVIGANWPFLDVNSAELMCLDISPENPDRHRMARMDGR